MSDPFRNRPIDDATSLTSVKQRVRALDTERARVAAWQGIAAQMEEIES